MLSISSSGRVVAGAVGLGLLLAPVRFVDPRDGLVRVNDACGQATECESTNFKICSTHHADYKDHKCTKGCGTEEE
jgi:hypothetical protein